MILQSEHYSSSDDKIIHGRMRALETETVPAKIKLGGFSIGYLHKVWTISRYGGDFFFFFLNHTPLGAY